MPIPSAMPTLVVLYQNNTQQVSLNGLQDQQGNIVNDSTNMTATLLDENRNGVEEFGIVPMPYVVASNGNYQGIVDLGFEPSVGTGYTLVIDGDGIAGSSHIHVEIPAEVKVRTT